MEIAKIVLSLIASLTTLVADAVEAYMAGDPSKLKRVQDILPQSQKLKAEAVAELEREKTRRALERTGRKP